MNNLVLKNSLLLFMAFYLLLLSCSCGKTKLEGDSQYDHSLISFDQHVRAVTFANLQFNEGKATIKDSGIIFSFNTGKFLEDSIIVRGYTLDTVAPEAFDFIFSTTNTVEELELSLLQPKLWFRFDGKFRQQAGPDTVLSYFIPLSDDRFYY